MEKELVIKGLRAIHKILHNLMVGKGDLSYSDLEDLERVIGALEHYLEESQKLNG